MSLNVTVVEGETVGDVLVVRVLDVVPVTDLVADADFVGEMLGDAPIERDEVTLAVSLPDGV